jgi:hypothetical protein
VGHIDRLNETVCASEQIVRGVFGLRSSRLHIDVKGRVVTIRGHVHSVEQRQNAVRIARGIVGLRALVLQVGISSPPHVQAVSQKDTTAKDFG